MFALFRTHSVWAALPLIATLLSAPPALADGRFTLWDRGGPPCSYGPFVPNPEGGHISSWGTLVAGNFSGDSYSEVFLYDPHDGLAEFRSPDTTSHPLDSIHMALIGSTIPVRDSWSAIVSGNFDGSGFDDLFFYDPLAAEGEFWSTDGAGGLNGIGPTWTGISPRAAMIVAGNFGPEAQSELMFYNPSGAQLTFYSTVTRTEIGTVTGVPTSWTKIVAGNFGGGTAYSDFFCYDAANGRGTFYRTDGAGGISTIGPTIEGLRTTWNQVFAGRFRASCDAPSALDDLYFCQKHTGETEFYGTDGAGGISQFETGSADATWGLSVPGSFRGVPWQQVLGYAPGWVVSPVSNVCIVAHCDDDFLFMNPEIEDALLRRERLRIVYLTAGQVDQGADFWRDGRERGALRGYAMLAGTPGSSWSVVESGTPALYRLDAYPQLELQFVRIPSGDEWGYPSDPPYPGSLTTLWHGTDALVGTVDGAMVFSRSSLVQWLLDILDDVRPSRICLLDLQGWTGALGEAIPDSSADYMGIGGTGVYAYDHKDHCASARFGASAVMQYTLPHTVSEFVGYTIALDPSNVTGNPLRQKLIAFSEYARFDKNINVPHPFTGLYDPWISRQYHRLVTVDVVEGAAATSAQPVSVSPNPSRHDLMLTMSSAMRGRARSFAIFDVGGRRCRSGELPRATAGAFPLRTAGLPAGVYLVRVLDAEGRALQTSRFVRLD